MAVFKDKIVPIPKVKGITINRSDSNRVFFVKEAPFNAKKGFAEPKRITIGYVTDDDVKYMHPTTGYKTIFPKEWEKLFGEKLPIPFKFIGMYAVTESVNMLTGIKDTMDLSFGISNSDAMIDFVMYSLLHGTNVTEHFPIKMSEQQLYSGNALSDSFYSDLFKEKITYAQILDFKKRWALQCKEDGVEEVWICIDGSNDDCVSAGVTLAEKGHAKSLRNRKVISFTFAVTEDGKPVTFEIYRGGLVDAKAMKRILSFLKEVGIRVKGVILERGYCDSNALRYLNREGIAYVIMLKGSPDGYKTIVEDYGNTIKLNAEYLIRDTKLFGVQKTVQLFDNYPHNDYLTLFYDYENGSKRISALLKKLYAEIDRCEKILAKGEIPVIASQLNNVLTISDDKTQIDIITGNLQKLFDEKGENLKPEKVHHLYQCRDCSETDYMIFKTHLGFGKVRVRATKSVQSKFAIGFIASCIRYELENAAKKVHRSTPEVIQEVSHLYMSKIGESYVPIQGVVGIQEIIFNALDNSVSILSDIAKDENDRLAGRKPTPRHRKPSPNQKKIATDSTSSDTKKKKPEKNGKKVAHKKKPGVKPGTKRSETNKDGTIRKKPGVPKGTKRGLLNKDGSPRKKPGPKSIDGPVVA